MSLKSKPKFLVYMVLVSASLFFLAQVYAATSHSSHHHQASVLDLKWYWINFLVYIAILYILLRDAAKVAWHNRHDSIKDAVSKGKIARANAQAALERAQAQLKNVEQDVINLRTEIATETEHECRQIIDDAKKRAQVLAQRARTQGEVEKRAMQLRIQSELSHLVVAKAREKLSRELNLEKDKLIRERGVSALSLITA